jgi:hypothetical protein
MANTNTIPDIYRDNEHKVDNNFADKIREKARAETKSVAEVAHAEVQRLRDVTFWVNTEHGWSQLRLRDGDTNAVITKFKPGAKLRILADAWHSNMPDDDRNRGTPDEHIFVKVEADAADTEKGGTGTVQWWVSTEYIKNLSDPTQVDEDLNYDPFTIVPPHGGGEAPEVPVEYEDIAIDNLGGPVDSMDTLADPGNEYNPQLSPLIIDDNKPEVLVPKTDPTPVEKTLPVTDNPNKKKTSEYSVEFKMPPTPAERPWFWSNFLNTAIWPLRKATDIAKKWLAINIEKGTKVLEDAKNIPIGGGRTVEDIPEAYKKAIESDREKFNKLNDSWTRRLWNLWLWNTETESPNKPEDSSDKPAETSPEEKSSWKEDEFYESYKELTKDEPYEYTGASNSDDSIILRLKQGEKNISISIKKQINNDGTFSILDAEGKVLPSSKIKEFVAQEIAKKEPTTREKSDTIDTSL